MVDTGSSAPRPTSEATVQDRLQIRDTLRKLSLEHRDVICRVYYLKWTMERTAADLKITEAAAKSRLHHAVHSLSVALQETSG
jgi:DNA-directed RNA polymerase specialized sigma24 family protein